MKALKSLILLLIMAQAVVAQTSDDAFKRPLKEVIAEIETRFGIKIRYPEELVKDRMVTYAGWRFRPDAEVTMTNIFASQDITFAKEGDKKYKLQAFQYHLKTPLEGKQQLDYLSTLYTDQPSWEKRKAELRACMAGALGFGHFPETPKSKPIVTNKRIMDGYTVENVALETLPGYYVCGSLYKPLNISGLMPVMINPNGHFKEGRYTADIQVRCAMQARMGIMCFNYDLLAYGESLLQFKAEDHRRALANSVQVWNGMKILDWLLAMPNADRSRVGVTGASGGGSQTMFLTALDDRITHAVPTVMMSSYHSGGCPCESGSGLHLCGGGTNNVEIAAMAAPKLQLIISDGKDWTQQVPTVEYPHVAHVYGFYGKKGNVANAHFAQEGHDYGISKRLAMYDFIAKNFNLDSRKVQDSTGKFDESKCKIETADDMKVFGKNGENLPKNAIVGFDNLVKVLKK